MQLEELSEKVVNGPLHIEVDAVGVEGGGVVALGKGGVFRSGEPAEGSSLILDPPPDLLSSFCVAHPLLVSHESTEGKGE